MCMCVSFLSVLTIIMPGSQVMQACSCIQSIWSCTPTYSQVCTGLKHSPQGWASFQVHTHKHTHTKEDDMTNFLAFSKHSESLYLPLFDIWLYRSVCISVEGVMADVEGHAMAEVLQAARKIPSCVFSRQHRSCLLLRSWSIPAITHLLYVESGRVC